MAARPCQMELITISPLATHLKRWIRHRTWLRDDVSSQTETILEERLLGQAIEDVAERFTA